MNAIQEVGLLQALAMTIRASVFAERVEVEGMPAFLAPSRVFLGWWVGLPCRAGEADDPELPIEAFPCAKAFARCEVDNFPKLIEEQGANLLALDVSEELNAGAFV